MTGLETATLRYSVFSNLSFSKNVMLSVVLAESEWFTDSDRIVSSVSSPFSLFLDVNLRLFLRRLSAVIEKETELGTCELNEGLNVNVRS